MALLRLRSDLALVGICLGLYIGAAAQARTGESTALTLAVSTVLKPVTALANSLGYWWNLVWAGERSLSETVAELGRLREEADALRRSNQLLTAELAALRQGSQLLARFPSLSDNAVLARVQSRDVVLTHTLDIDRGRADGVRLDAPVLAGEGLLGRVDRVSDRTARVQLLTHPAAAAAVRVLGLTGEGLLVGGTQPAITQLPPYTKVPVDTAVVSSGSEGIYPPGLLVGTTLEGSTKGLFTVVPVLLAVRATETMVVLVLPAVGQASS
ncbi:MAG: rod shape-determining protein MreC [Thermoanaerobaculaceae bacterium]|nr:rod shape-determining protein MreC [Thermoanaerobaculaceae bacterium]MDI9620874.1 rod shape-determining protein MreC [Acidobacteriota bacterium]NLH10145.1 rod shape-determining protein MreC [Holophagae bacterium]HPW54742.1 rod shape-determining protein MreC [Thermoanaerobaculaceae bacterium]